MHLALLGAWVARRNGCQLPSCIACQQRLGQLLHRQAGGSLILVACLLLLRCCPYTAGCRGACLR